MSPSLALGWQVWTRHRLGMSLSAGYVLSLAIVARMLPIKSFSSEWVVFLILMPCASTIGYLVAVLSIGLDAQIERRESGFPRRMWTLPLPTWLLVGWPMFGGASVLALVWLAWPWSVLASPDLDLNMLIWLPPLMLAVTLAWLQALVWSPMPLPGLRLFLLGPLIGVALIGPQMLLVTASVHPSLGYTLLAAQLPLAYVTAVYGVSRARRGDVPHWNWPGWPMWLRWTSVKSIGRPFGSPARALLWYEWRRHGLAFPLVLAGTALLWCPLIPTIAEIYETAEKGGQPIVSSVLLHDIGGLWLAAAPLLLFPSMMAAVIGCELGRLPGRERKSVLSSFVATRPVSTRSLITAKFQMAALTTLAGWIALALGFLLWFALSGKAAEMTAALDALRTRQAAGLFWAWLALVLLGAVGLTWLQMVQGMWLGLIPERWRIAATLGIFTILIFVAPLTASLAKSSPCGLTIAEILPWLAGGIAALKLLLAAWSLRALTRYRVLPPALVGRALALWVILAVGLFGVLYGLLPAGTASISAIVLGIALLVPLTRLALAPLALDWNRHR